jgi:hypothetical protein
LTIENPQLQVILSVKGGRTLQEADVRELHEKTVVPLCQKVTPLEKRPGDVLILEATCHAAQETMVAKYIAGPGGLIVITAETVTPLDRCTQREVDKLFKQVRLQFMRVVPDRPLPDDGLSACPQAVRAVLPKSGMCLEPALLGEERVRTCGSQLEKKGWKKNALLESEIGERTGKGQVCYDRP